MVFHLHGMWPWESFSLHSLYTFDRVICCAVQHNCSAFNCIPKLPVDILRYAEATITNVELFQLQFSSQVVKIFLMVLVLLILYIIPNHRGHIIQCQRFAFSYLLLYVTSCHVSAEFLSYCRISCITCDD